MKHARLVTRLLLGGIFLVAGLLKVNHTWALAQDIYNYRLLSLETVGFVAAVLPWLEMILGASLVVGFWVESSALALGGLSLGLCLALASALWRHLDINCGCFHGVTTVSAGHLALSLTLGAMAAYLSISDSRNAD